MASHAKIAQQFARQLFGMTLIDGVVSPERVSGVLEYVEKHPTPNPVLVLKAYHRLVAGELARGEAVVEHAGTVDEAMLGAIAAAMSKKYGRKIAAYGKPSDGLIAGMRVRVGDDVYESSVAAQLATLAQGS